MKIKVGDFDVYESGCVITHLGKSVCFYIENLIFEFAFENDSNLPESKTNVFSDTNNNKKLVFEFINFNNELGQGIKEPVKIALIDNKDLYLQYYIYSFGDNNSKIIKYTWLTKDRGE